MAATATVLKFENYRLHAFERQGSKLPWFVLAEVCRVLELRNPSYVAKRVPDAHKDIVKDYTLGGSQQTLIISLSGLTRITGSSHKAVAARFNDWLHSDVVVSLYLAGEYKGDTAPLEDLVGSFQPLLDLPEPVTKRENVVPFAQPSPEPLPELKAPTDRHITRAFERLAEPTGDIEDRPIFARLSQSECKELGIIRGVMQRGHWWTDPVTGQRSVIRSMLDASGRLVELWVHSAKFRITNMKVAPIQVGPPEARFWLRYDMTLAGTTIALLLQLECEHRVSEEQKLAVRDLLRA